jgi:hypothetical protein
MNNYLDGEFQGGQVVVHDKRLIKKRSSKKPDLKNI